MLAGFLSPALGLDGLAEFSGGHPHVFGELEVEVILSLIAHQLCDAGDGQVGLQQQVLGLADATAGEILHGGVAADLLEHVGEVIGAGVEGVPQSL